MLMSTLMGYGRHKFIVSCIQDLLWWAGSYHVASSNIFKFIFYSLIHQKSHQESAALVHKYTREEHLSQKKMQRDGILFQIYLSCLIFVIFIHSCWCFSCILTVYLGYIPLVLVQWIIYFKKIKNLHLHKNRYFLNQL